MIEVLGVGAVGRWHGVAGKGFLGVHPAAFDQIGVDSCPRVHVMVGVVHVLMEVALKLQWPIGREAIRLDGSARRDVLADDGEDGVCFSICDWHEDDAAPVFFADDAQHPHALGPPASIVLPLAKLGLVYLYGDMWGGSVWRE